MNVLSVVGARPQFVKLKPVSTALRARGLAETVVHTGQHYDYEMSAAFFEELELPAPDVHLGTPPGPTSAQCGFMIARLGEVIADARPDVVLVFGDTTSTLAGAVAGRYAGVRVAHVEAGMRSFVRTMPEEINRVATDRLSDVLFTASADADRHLAREGRPDAVNVGDVMLDVVRLVGPRTADPPALLREYGLAPGGYALATIHRAANTDDPARLAALLALLGGLGLPVVLPLHPRTRKAAEAAGLDALLAAPALHVTPPLPYVATIALARHARRVFTDSGGLQKEAFYVGTPCTTLRDETEWVETVALGWNVLAGADAAVARASLALPPPPPVDNPYGDGHAALKIAAHLAG